MKESWSIRRCLKPLDPVVGESISGEPLLEASGNRQILVENQRGILEYNSQTIRIQTDFGEYCICGENLEVRRMTGSQLVIQGVVEQILFLRGTCQ